MVPELLHPVEPSLTVYDFSGSAVSKELDEKAIWLFKALNIFEIQNKRVKQINKFLFVPLFFLSVGKYPCIAWRTTTNQTELHGSHQ